MLKIAIIDDEKEILNITKTFANKYFFLKDYRHEITTFTNSEVFLESDYTDLDIILLDIEMPLIDGITVATKIRETNKFAYLCFVTGYEKYISESYKIHAFEYLLKPVTQEKIDKLFDEIILYMKNSEKNEKKISFSTTNGKLLQDISKILYLEYINSSKIFGNRNIKLVTYNEVFIIKDKISNVFDSLGMDCFAMPHRAFIINFQNVKLIKQNIIIMNNGTEIPLSQKKVREIKKMFNAYIIKYAGESI